MHQIKHYHHPFPQIRSPKIRPRRIHSPPRYKDLDWEFDSRFDGNFDQLFKEGFTDSIDYDLELLPSKFRSYLEKIDDERRSIIEEYNVDRIFEGL